jgi:hypothetical protein
MLPKVHLKKTYVLPNAGATLIVSITAIRATTLNNITMRFFVRHPLPLRAGLVSPAALTNVATPARGDEFPMNSWRTSQNSDSTHSGE